MKWYAAIARFSPDEDHEIYGLSIKNQPETSWANSHIYIDHMMMEGDTLFGTAR